VAVNRTLKTNKTFESARINGLLVVALDANEQFKSQEATVLSRAQAPQTLRCEEREVELREVKDLSFGEAATVRVVLAEERWTERQQRAGRFERVARTSQWRWLVTGGLDGYGPAVIWRVGHQRWGVENHAFNELTQHYHLTHCPRHELVAILAWLLIRVLGFNLFELFVRLHGKLWRQGRVTLQELPRQLDRALEAVAELTPLWSG